MQRHGEQLEVPRVAEMSGDDLEIRKSRGRRVQPDRPGEVDADALPARLAGPDAAGPGVKQADEPELLALLVERPMPLFVRRERLQRGMQLHALQPKLGDAIDLFDRAVALQRIHAPESHKRFRICADRISHDVIWHPRPAGRRLRVPRQKHRDDVQRVVLLSQLVERLARDLGPEIGLGRLDVTFHRDVEPAGRRQVDVKIDRLHGATTAARACRFTLNVPTRPPSARIPTAPPYQRAASWSPMRVTRYPAITAGSAKDR